jgi:hypothetical protein
VDGFTATKVRAKDGTTCPKLPRDSRPLAKSSKAEQLKELFLWHPEQKFSIKMLCHVKIEPQPVGFWPVKMQSPGSSEEIHHSGKQ